MAVHHLGLEEQPPGRDVGVVPRDRDPGLDLAGGPADDVVEEAARLAGVARDLGDAPLVVVELLERLHRQEDVVLLEPEEARRVVHQDVGVQDEELGGGGPRLLARLLGGRPLGAVGGVVAEMGLRVS